jgi:hypothetical protein
MAESHSLFRWSGKRGPIVCAEHSEARV